MLGQVGLYRLSVSVFGRKSHFTFGGPYGFGRMCYTFGLLSVSAESKTSTFGWPLIIVIIIIMSIYSCYVMSVTPVCICLYVDWCIWIWPKFVSVVWPCVILFSMTSVGLLYVTLNSPHFSMMYLVLISDFASLWSTVRFFIHLPTAVQNLNTSDSLCFISMSSVYV